MIAVMFLAQVGGVSLTPTDRDGNGTGGTAEHEHCHRAGIFRTFLNVTGDTMVAILVAGASDEVVREVCNGHKDVTAEDLVPEGEATAGGDGDDSERAESRS